MRWFSLINLARRDVRKSGQSSTPVHRQLGISEATFYVWKKKFGSLGATEVRKLRLLREENSNLKRLSGFLWRRRSEERRVGKEC